MSGKRILLIGLVLVLLAAIPLTVYLVQQQQKTRISAVAKTTLSFDPSAKTVNVGETFSLAVKADPGANANQISLVKFTINYDPAKLATAAAGASGCPASPNDALCANTSAFPLIMQGPIYELGKISMTLSVGNDLTKAVKALTTAGTITFTALSPTDTGNPTKVTYSDAPDTKVLSIGSNDQFNENVLLDRIPALITIIESGNPTEAPTAAPTAGPTESVTAVPTQASTQQTTATGPVCTSLTIAPSASGTAPYSVNLTANGQSSNSTISKVTFDFGDGQTQDVTEAQGIGTNSISVLQSHIYNNPGNYTATAVLTDDTGAVSPVGSCSVAISVNNGTQAAPTVIAEQPSPLPPTGPSQLITIGSIGAVIAIIGVVLLFAL